jgi:hypothetical protein
MLNDCKSSLLKIMKGGQQPNEDILTALKQLTQVVVSQVDTRVTPRVSPAQYGDEVLRKAKAYGMHTTFSKGEGEPALGPETLKTVAACKSEHQLVALLTRPLEDIFGDSVCLVNSEEYAWLETSKDKAYNQKPDMFLCHEEIYTEMPVPRMKITEPNKESRKFGVLSDWALRDCLAATFEAKLKINNNAVGEAANYGNHIMWGANAPPLAKIVLFDKKKFLLMEVSCRSIKITECQWDTPGSKTLLHDFPLYQNPWTVLVKEACQKWKLEISRGVNGSAWLGSGASGRVFQVKRNGSYQPMALKVVLESNIAALSMEKQMLRQAARGKCDFVMPIEENKEDLGWALLMSHVGSPVKSNQYEAVIRLLAALHANGFIHGDPRLANVVSVKNKLYWIDFMAVQYFATQEAKVADMKKLVADILHPTVMEESESLDGYGAREDGAREDAVRAVILYVSQHIQYAEQMT